MLLVFYVNAIKTLGVWGHSLNFSYDLRSTRLQIVILFTIICEEYCSSSLVVGTPSYPERAPALALIEYYRLFIAPPQEIPALTRLRQSDPAERLTQNLAAIAKIPKIAEASQTEFVLVLTLLLKELQGSAEPDEISARKRLQELVLRENIKYLDFLTI